MKKYYFKCLFDSEIYSNTTKRNEKSYYIIADLGSKMEDMYDAIDKFANKENFTLKGKKSGTVFRNNIKVGKFSIKSEVIQ